MSMSESIAELAKALAMAQSEIKGAAKDSTNPHFKTKYADLASVWDACREPLTKNGLSVAQSTRMEGNAVVVITMLLHSSGEYIRGEISLPPTKPDPQGHGSAITYARRYALAAMVGIAPEDDDGWGLVRQQTRTPTANAMGRHRPPPRRRRERDRPKHGRPRMSQVSRHLKAWPRLTFTLRNTQMH